jgi:NADP-dependent 3-hydroxy acid dehydrogenase YdfG
MSDIGNTRRTIFIAGATGGMGSEIARVLAGQHDLVLAGRDGDKLVRLREELITAGAAGVRTIRLDFGREDVLDQLGPVAADHPPQIVVNAVGTNIRRRALRDIEQADWAGMMRANLDACFALAKAFLPAMRERQDGLIINIASTAAKYADKSGAAYQASKAGVLAITRAINVEECQSGIRASAVLPGMTDTDLLSARPIPVTERERALAIPPSEIARICAFLVSLPKEVVIREIEVVPTFLQ